MSVQDEGFKGGKRAQRALELRRLALVLQIVAPHLVELAAHGAGVAEDLIAHVHLPVSWKQRHQISQLGESQLRRTDLAERIQRKQKEKKKKKGKKTAVSG